MTAGSNARRGNEDQVTAVDVLGMEIELCKPLKGSNIFVVGNTGAGKSTFQSAFLAVNSNVFKIDVAVGNLRWWTRQHSIKGFELDTEEPLYS